jgi:hypothetical protein
MFASIAAACAALPPKPNAALDPPLRTEFLAIESITFSAFNRFRLKAG